MNDLSDNSNKMQIVNQSLEYVCHNILGKLVCSEVADSFDPNLMNETKIVLLARGKET